MKNNASTVPSVIDLLVDDAYDIFEFRFVRYMAQGHNRGMLLRCVSDSRLEYIVVVCDIARLRDIFNMASLHVFSIMSGYPIDDRFS